MERPHPNRGICRMFLSGNCTYGDRCRYRHERPTQICRHFQKGGCWFGNSCKFLHVQSPGRRLPEPSVSSFPFNFSTAAGQSDRGDPMPTPRVSQLQSNRPTLNQNSTEGHSQEIPITSSVLGRDIEHIQANTKNEEPEGATAAPESANLAQAIERSKDLTCGICWEKVLEKPIPKFGILPNCTHCFCLECIQRWRKTSDVSPAAVKSCPICRVNSGFFVPHDNWVEGREKEILIDGFKKKCNHKTCHFFLRRGHCPFKSDCLYRHDRTLARPSLEIPEDLPPDVLGFLIDMAIPDSEDETDDTDDDDEEISLINVLLSLGFF